MTVRTLTKALERTLSPYDARIILETLLSCSHTQLVLRCEEEVSDHIAETAFAMQKRRESGEPIQYITGVWRFFGREYLVGKGVLIPRDDTEVVVGESLKLIPTGQKLSVLDLCAGCGIIGITIKKERPHTQVTAVEKSEEAFSYLQKNAEKNAADIRLILSDLCDCRDEFEDGSLDLIVSNPPYIKRRELCSLQREVQFEPSLALDGGESGFDFYEKIIRLYAKKLKKGGFFAFEIGEDQSERLSSLLKDAGFAKIRVFSDIQSLPRAVTARKN